MKVVVATRVTDAACHLDRHIAFHVAAGADVLVSGAPDDALGHWEASDRVRRVEGAGQTELARAAAEHGADWVIPSGADEFWWPRGESLADVLAVIPPRYGIVQALVRTFVPVGEKGAAPDETTLRESLHGPGAAGGRPIAELLRPVYRAEPEMEIDDSDWTDRGRRVPLRAWYPLEVFRFPAGAEAPGDSIDALLAERTLVEDVRLRDALREIDRSGGAVEFPVPNIVDDASYAIECAAVGEVDLVALDKQIRELELRIAALEARFWPTVRRGLRRLARRPS